MNSGGLAFKGTDRFDILRRLGAGGMGVVYEALDRERQQLVALKVLRSMNAHALMMFKNEFRALQDLHHPNLVTLGELLEAQGTWFFTMELIGGSSFLEYVRLDGAAASTESDDSDTLVLSARARGGGPDEATASRPRRRASRVDYDRLRRALVQVAGGLHELHSARKVHRDIKPSNILVESSGRVVILDFGLVSDLGGGGAASRPLIVGTPAFMAPEQFESGQVAPECDCYALGAMLYLALTGSVPVTGPDELIVVLKRSVIPIAPRSLSSDVPADLDELCMHLLAVDPKLRPTMRDILDRFGAAPSASAGLRTGGARSFIGRQRELTLLREAFAETVQHPMTILVSGDSGIGKTALVGRFAEELAADHSAAVLVGRCYERESVPYKGIDSLIDSLSRHLASLPPDEVKALAPSDAGLLATLFPVLRENGWIGNAEQQDRIALDPRQVRASSFRALRALLSRMAERARVVLVIDDVHWSDKDSMALLSQLFAPPDAPPLLLIVTARTSAPQDPEGLSRESLSLVVGEVRELCLEPLSREEASELAAYLIERQARDHKTVIAESLAVEANGHPLFIDALVRQRLGHATADGRFGLDDALWSVVLELDEPARRLLEILAVAGRPIEQHVACDAVGTEPGEFTARVSSLRAANLISTSGVRARDRIEPYHGRIRDAVLAHLNPNERAKRHYELARALEHQRVDDPEALAEHWREAGELRHAARNSLQAAERAAAALAFDHSAQLLRRAIELDPELASADVRRQLGDALANAGRGADAAEAYLLAAASAGTAEERLELERRAAEQLLRGGHIDRGLTTLRSVLAEVGMRLAASPARALPSLLWGRARVRLRGLGFAERAASQIPSRDLTRVDTCWSAAAGLSMVDTIRGAEFQTRHLLLALAAGEPRRICRALAVEAAYAAAGSTRSRRRALALIGDTESLARKLEDPHLLAMATGIAGILDFLGGSWKSGLERCDEAAASLKQSCIGVAWELDTAVQFGLFCLLHMGRLHDLRSRVEAQLREAQERGDLYAETTVRVGPAAMPLVGANRPDEARRTVAEAIARWSKDGFKVQHYNAMLSNVQIDLYQGVPEASWQRTQQSWPALRRSMLLRVPLLRFLYEDACARLALAHAHAGRDAKRWLREVERLAERIAKGRAPWTSGLAMLLDAGVLAARGTPEAAAAYGRAAELLDAADMYQHAAAARRRRGELIGGSEGDALIAQADETMLRHGAVLPARFACVLAPAVRR